MYDYCRFRQYGLWERYAELYPDSDLVYTIGESDYKKDWFFAQVTRYYNDTPNLSSPSQKSSDSMLIHKLLKYNTILVIS